MFDRICMGVCLLALIGCAPSYAEDAAWRRAGLWEVSIRKDGDSIMQAIKVRQCSDVKSEPDVLLSIIPGQEHCAPLKSQRSRGKAVIHSHCGEHDATVDASLTMSGDFDVAYGGGFRLRRAASGAAGAPRTEAVLFDARWLGPCTAGMSPGDMVLSNGIKVNVLKDKKAHESEYAHAHEHRE